MSQRKINRKSINKAIKRRAKDGNPLINDDLRELAIEITAEIGAHPAGSIVKVTEGIEELMRDRLVVHINGVLRPALESDQRTLALRDERANTKLKLTQRGRAKRRKEKQHGTLTKQQRAFRILQDDLVTA